MLAWKTEGTELYQALPHRLHTNADARASRCARCRRIARRSRRATAPGTDERLMTTSDDRIDRDRRSRRRAAAARQLRAGRVGRRPTGRRRISSTPSPARRSPRRRPAGSTSRRWSSTPKRVGGPALRRMTFHQRALMLKAMAQYLMARKDEFYAVSAATGATKTRFVGRHRRRHRDVLRVRVARPPRDSRTRRSMSTVPTETLSKGGTFVGRHICVPLEGVAVHINAFNFPVWGMLEKLAPTLLAGMPAIVKPATVTSYLTEVGVSRDDRVEHPSRRARFSCSAAAPAICSTTSTARAPSRSPARRRRARCSRRRRRSSITTSASTWKRTRSTTRCSAPTPTPGSAGVRSLHQGSRARDDDEGRPEVHGDSSHVRAREHAATT